MTVNQTASIDGRAAALLGMPDQPLHTLKAYEQRAQSLLSPDVWAYLHGAAADGLTHAQNQQAWQSMHLAPRVLSDMAGAHTRTRLLGREVPSPLLVAPMAALRLAHRDGEAAVALAAAAQGVGFVLSGQSSQPHAQVAALLRDEPGRGPLWQQIHLHGDADLNTGLAEEASAAGFEALVVTVDAPVQGARDAQAEAGFRMPAHLIADRRHQPTPPAVRSGLCAGWSAQAGTWQTLERLTKQCRLPVLLKGVTHPDDARKAEQLGCQGLIVSNHGGRILDTMPATAHLLSDVAACLSPHMTVLVDGGIRRGTDILKALALGAHAVLVGRPVIAGLTCAGASGAAHVLRLLLDEFEMAMSLCGCHSPLMAGPALIHRTVLQR